MRARLSLTLVLLWLSLALLASWVQQPGAGPTVPAARPFTHVQHVPKEWYDGKEVWRDCRGCHRFDAQNPVSAPQRECDQCHRAPGLLGRQFEAGWQDDLGGHRTRTRDAFRHHTHAMLECRQCHGANDLAELKLPRQEEDFPFDDFQVRTGPGQCAECHERGRAELSAFRFFGGASDETLARQMGLDKPFVPPTREQFAAYAEKLVTVFAGPTGGLNTTPLPPGGDFGHGDHPGIDCIVCHTSIQGARANAVGIAAIVPATLVTCGKCHIGDERSTALPVASAPKQQLRPLASLGTFAHGDHFVPTRKQGVCSEPAYAQIEQKKCEACHTYAPDAIGRAGRDFPFAAGKSKHRYGDCIGCHDAGTWQTGESAAVPRHASTGGEGNGWARCTACHVFGQGTMTAVRPSTEVARFAERTFEFAANVHPDITAKGIVRSEQNGRPAVPDCKQCHRAKVPELATRLVKKVFRHDTHLPAAPTAANCVACHPSASTATASAQLASDGRTYSLANCGDCHWGGEVKDLAVATETGKRTCVEFAHGPHVTAAKLSCSECHAVAAGGQDITTLPAALACSKCHDHKTGGPTREELFDEAAGSCARCHHEASAPLVAAVPAIRGSAAVATDPRYRAEQSSFAGFAQAQFHPLDGKCADCHQASPGKPIELRISNHVFATRTDSVHKGNTQKEPQGCLGCHWKPVGTAWATSVRSTGATEVDMMFRLKPGSAATRAEFGNLREGYPGNERPRR